MMRPLRVAALQGGHVLIERIAARACQMQGMPEVHYGLMTAKDRAAAERGVFFVLAALESLNCTVMAPDELSPTLPHDREDPR